MVILFLIIDRSIQFRRRVAIGRERGRSTHLARHGIIGAVHRAIIDESQTILHFSMQLNSLVHEGVRIGNSEEIPIAHQHSAHKVTFGILPGELQRFAMQRPCQGRWTCEIRAWPIYPNTRLPFTRSRKINRSHLNHTGVTLCQGGDIQLIIKVSGCTDSFSVQHDFKILQITILGILD